MKCKQNFSLVKSEYFGGVTCDFYQDRDEIWMTRRQVGEALEYRFPEIAIGKIHERYKERLDRYSVLTKMTSTDGKKYDVYLYSMKGVYEICRWSNKHKANQFIDWAWDVIEKIRKGQMTHEMQRAIGKAIRRTLAESIRDSDLNIQLKGWGYKTVTDLVCKVAIGCTAAQFRKSHGLDKDTNIREHLDGYQLNRINQAEKLAQALADTGSDYDHIKVVLEMTFSRPVLVEAAGC